MAIFKNWPIFGEKHGLIAHGFFQKMDQKSQKNFITFSDTYRCPYAM